MVTFSCEITPEGSPNFEGLEIAARIRAFRRVAKVDLDVVVPNVDDSSVRTTTDGSLEVRKIHLGAVALESRV